MIKKTTFLLAVLALNGYANDWPNWRGPNHNGATDAAGLPVKFSKTENIAWKVTMPGPSAATPIISGDRVFVSSTNPKAKELLALCFDRRTGKEIWRRVVGTGYQLDDRSNYASPSPVTDGEVVTFFYGNGDLATFDLEGKKLWAKKIQGEENGFAFQWTFSTSPLLHGGILYLQILQRDTGVRGHGKANGNESYLLALNPKTGKQLWKHNRPSNAKAENRRGTLALGHVESLAHRTLAPGALARRGRWRDPRLRAQRRPRMRRQSRCQRRRPVGVEKRWAHGWCDHRRLLASVL